MPIIPRISTKVLSQARQVWKESIAEYGREVVLSNLSGDFELRIRAFAKRPKILGQFDRTEQSYDQEKYMVLMDADDFPPGVTPEKFMRVSWDGEDHAFIGITRVDLKGVVFGYRILVKG